MEVMKTWCLIGVLVCMLVVPFPGMSEEVASTSAMAINQDVVDTFRLIMGRAACPWEAQRWTQRHEAGMSLFEIRRELGNSPELVTSIRSFIARPAFSQTEQWDLELIVLDYQRILGRYPDLAGLQYWKQRHEEGMTWHGIRNSIAETDEARAFQAYLAGLRPEQPVVGSQYDQEVMETFRLIMGRVACPWEAQRWTEAHRAGMSLNEIRRHLGNSPELIDEIVVELNKAFRGEPERLRLLAIVTLYQEELGRYPDRQGLLYWEGELINGNFTLESLREHVRNTDEAREYREYLAADQNERAQNATASADVGSEGDGSGVAGAASEGGNSAGGESGESADDPSRTY